jgi:hypothetical protein
VAIIDYNDDFEETSQNILIENIEIQNIVNIIEKKFKENVAVLLNDEEIDC